MSAASLPSLKADAPSCVLTSEREEGPFYIDGTRLRRDITEGKPGTPLILRIALFDAKRCSPLSQAAVDIWHCDAEGIYSGFTSDNRNQFGRGWGMPPPPPPPGSRGRRQVDATRFLRGVQITNDQGIVEFATVYPGWYQGRAIHIHTKIHLGGDAAADTYEGGHVSHTGQLFFPEDVTQHVAAMQPYAKHLDVRRTTLEQDYIYRSGHDGGSSIVKLESVRPERFVATAILAVDPTATPRPVAGPPRRV
jgi:protocatechuate 3,4-dioxygenase beta subunit